MQNNNLQFNSGLRLCRKKPQELIGSSTTPLVQVNLSGEWKNYLSPHEHQRRYGFETWTCTIENMGNDSREALMNFLIASGKIPLEDIKWLRNEGYLVNGKINFDDRIPAMFADIQKGVGTFVFKGMNACMDWSLPEGILYDQPKNFEEFIDRGKLTTRIDDLNNEFKRRFHMVWWWVDSKGDGSFDEETVREKRKSSPLGATVVYADGDGCLNPPGTHNHGVLNIGEDECYEIDDSYLTQFKKYQKTHLRNFCGWTINLKNMPKFVPKNNELYLLVEGPEQKLAMGLDGRLVIYDNKVDALINAASRSKEYKVPVPLTMEMWDQSPKIDGRGNKL